MNQLQILIIILLNNINRYKIYCYIGIRYIVEFNDFIDTNFTDSFNLKVKLTGKTGDDGTKNVEIMMPLKYLSKFWKTLEMSLINCETTRDLN